MSPLERTGRGSAENTDRGRQINQVAGMGTSGPAPNGAMGATNLVVGAPIRHDRRVELPLSRPSSRADGNGDGGEPGVPHFSPHGLRSQLLFFDTFSHEVIEELNLDLVQVNYLKLLLYKKFKGLPIERI